MGRAKRYPLIAICEDDGFRERAQPVLRSVSRQLICPTGSRREFLSSPSAKNKSLRALVETALLILPSRLDQRGVSRSSRTWSAGCGGRGGARRRRAPLRTAKSCGPDAPTLASSFVEVTPRGDGGKRARSPGRARRTPLKPLRREGRTDPPTPVVTTVCYFFAHGPRVQRAPGLPCALLFSGRMNFLEKLGRIARRENADVCLGPASLRGALATNQSSFLFRGAMDCFAGARNDGA
jgi:hypothetical protein